MEIKNHTTLITLTAWIGLCLALQLSGSAHARTIRSTEWKTLLGHSDDVNIVAFSPDGKLLASGSDDKTIKLWSVETGREIRTMRGHTLWIHGIAFSPDGKMIASGSGDMTIKLWSVKTGQEIETLRGHSKPVQSVAFSPDGKILASASRDKSIKLWKLERVKSAR